MHFNLATVRLWSDVLKCHILRLSAYEGRHLLEGEAYSNLSVYEGGAY